MTTPVVDRVMVKAESPTVPQTSREATVAVGETLTVSPERVMPLLPTASAVSEPLPQPAIRVAPSNKKRQYFFIFYFFYRFVS